MRLLSPPRSPLRPPSRPGGIGVTPQTRCAPLVPPPIPSCRTEPFIPGATRSRCPFLADEAGVGSAPGAPRPGRLLGLGQPTPEGLGSPPPPASKPVGGESWITNSQDSHLQGGVGVLVCI